jgi:colanic acid/amylovoran biosynthesis protein
VLPKVNLIALREGREGIPLLKSLGIATDRILLTGDDAIELAYSRRNSQVGQDIGINLRLSNYAGLNESVILEIGNMLKRLARELDVQFIPIPISHRANEADMVSIRKIVDEVEGFSDNAEDPVAPIKVIEQIQRCRIVVTGSYHAAVFALAQGIPAICLAKSTYYMDKFLGLADQFGFGCEVISLNCPNFAEDLARAVKEKWPIAEQLKPQLLESAAMQIKSSRLAYNKVYELISRR